MESSNKEIKYIQVINENIDIAYDIQKKCMERGTR